jgi:hypothetical protein
MARISDSLISGMMNPTYGNRLADGVTQGMQGISDQYTKRRMDNANEGMLAVLNSGDPTDTNVQQSVMDIARQMNMDPVAAQEMIDSQITKKHQTEAQQRARESHLMAKANHEYRQGQQAEEKAQSEFNVKAVSQVNNGKSVDEVMQSVPEKYQASAKAAIERDTQFRENMRKVATNRKEGQPLSNEFLESIKDLPGMEGAIRAYHENKKLSPERANKILMQQYAVSHAQSLRTQPTGEDVKLAKWHTDLAEEYVDNVAAQIDTSGSSWFGMNTLQLDENPMVRDAVVLEVARRFAADKEWQPTKEAIEQIVKTVDTKKSSKGQDDEEAERRVQQAMEANPGMSREDVEKELRARNRI